MTPRLNFGPFSSTRYDIDRYIDQQIQEGAIKPLPEPTFSVPIIHPPPPKKKRQLWFLPRFGKRAPVTRLLSAVTTRQITRFQFHRTKTLLDRNRTGKIEES